MAGKSVFEMPVSRVYGLLLQKAERKGRTKEELDAVISWLFGYDMNTADMEKPYGRFLEEAPMMNPRAAMITGKVCGIAVETIEDPLTQRMRWLDKLVDELAKGRPMEKILR